MAQTAHTANHSDARTVTDPFMRRQCNRFLRAAQEERNDRKIGRGWEDFGWIAPLDVRWPEVSGWQDAGHRTWLAANRKDPNFGPVAEDSYEQLGSLLEEYMEFQLSSTPLNEPQNT